MKKIQYLLILIILNSLLYCKSDIKEKNHKTKIEKLMFRVENLTNFDLNKITIGLPDTTLIYKNLKKHSKTKWISIENTYYYGFVKFYDLKDRKYYISPIDYVGENLYKKGKMEFIIKSIDSTKNTFELNSKYQKSNETKSNLKTS